MNCKLVCKTSVFAINYNYISVKYEMCKRDWYCSVAHILGKEKINYISVYEPSPIICTLLELCDLKADNTNGSIFNIDEINHLIQTVCVD